MNFVKEKRSQLTLDKSTIPNRLSEHSDLEIFQEAATRLCQRYQQEHGNRFLFGSFDFVFHKGELKWIEERPRNKRFLDENSPTAKILPGGAR